MPATIPVYFHEDQLAFKPLYEWAFGDKISHPETTARAESILTALQGDPSVFEIRRPAAVPMGAIRDQHSYKLLTLYNAATDLPDGETFYPSVFPHRETATADPSNLQHAGYFCFDSGTPLNRRTLEAASWSAACAWEAAKVIRHNGNPASAPVRLSYALSRPPGHHASREFFGGYCYFNNAAIAASLLSDDGRVAVVDIDFHHGNGTQSLFYRDPRVLTMSIHGDPRECYPFFAGFRTECGEGPGDGYNLNVPLPRGADIDAFMAALKRRVLPNLANFDPEYLVVSAGFDAYELDPVGDFTLTTEDFATVGEALGATGYPTVVVQEGGYYSAHLGRNARSFLRGMLNGQQQASG